MSLQTFLRFSNSFLLFEKNSNKGAKNDIFWFQLSKYLTSFHIVNINGLAQNFQELFTEHTKWEPPLLESKIETAPKG